MKNPNDHIENRTRYLPDCSEVPQPTVTPRAPDDLLSYKLLQVPELQTARLVQRWYAKQYQFRRWMGRHVDRYVDGLIDVSMDGYSNNADTEIK
jgi:hypothetical protein